MASAQLKLLGTVGKGDAQVQVFGNLDKLKRDLRRLNKTGLPRALVRSINKTGDKTRTMVRTLIAKEHNLPARLVSKAISTVRANRNTTTYRLIAVGPRIAISSVKGFSGFASQKPLGVRINTGRGARIIKGAFVVRTRSGHIGVFKRKAPAIKPRTKQASSRGTVIYPQLKIRELTMPAIPHLLTADKTALRGWRFFSREFPVIFGKQLQFEINKAQGLG